MRRAFTLIEILVVIAIIGIAVSIAVMSVAKGQAMSRIRGSTRDIYATIRLARSKALVSGQPTIITYSTSMVDGESLAKVEITSASMLGQDVVKRAWNLSGEEIVLDDSDDADEGGGETVEQILFAPIGQDVLKGICVKVTKGDELLAYEQDEAREKPKISVFSNVDYLLDKFTSHKKDEEKKASESTSSDGAFATSTDVTQEPVSIVWEVNGRCEPHRVWIYAQGSSPEKGLTVKVDRFGAAKVLNPDEVD